MKQSTSDSTPTVPISRIYGLCDETGVIRYVGVTIRPLAERLKAHIREGKRCVLNHKARWIRSLSQDPTILLLEETHDRSREIYWISYYRSRGNILTNLTDGGEGSLGYVATEEARAKISKARQGKPGHPVSEETRVKQSAASRKYWEHPEAHTRMSEVHKSKPKSAETRARMSAAWTGRKKSEEHCANLRKAWVNRRKLAISDETREKLKRNFAGRAHSEETKQRMRESQIVAWEIRRAGQKQ